VFVKIDRWMADPHSKVVCLILELLASSKSAIVLCPNVTSRGPYSGNAASGQGNT